MSITQVIARPREHKRIVTVNGTHMFLCRLHADNQAVFGQQAITISKYLTALKHQAYFTPILQTGTLTTFLS
jgi:hypothetical protein